MCYLKRSSIPTLANSQQAKNEIAEIFLKYIRSDKISQWPNDELNDHMVISSLLC